MNEVGEGICGDGKARQGVRGPDPGPGLEDENKDNLGIVCGCCWLPCNSRGWRPA